MNIVKSIPFLLSIATGFNVAADELARHSVGVQGALGNAELSQSTNDSNHIAQLYFHYNYALDPVFSLEIGVNGGQQRDDWHCDQDDNDKWTCGETDLSLFDLNADKVEFENLVFAGKAQYELSQRNSLYVKLGIQFYDYKIKRGSSVLIDEAGSGIYAAAGWQYRWDSGIGMDVGLSLMKMGDLRATGTTIGINYAF